MRQFLVYVRHTPTGNVHEGTINATMPFNALQELHEYMEARGLNRANFEFLGWLPSVQATRQLTAQEVSELPTLRDF